MPLINRFAELQPEIAGWRQTLHAAPELLFDVHETAAFVAEKLRAFGCNEVVTGLGRTGVVGVIRGREPGPTIGLRADMDALPIREATGLAYASRKEGLMHACGHDGHTAMLLGAAKYLCETRRFAGNVVVIFQPAEEGGGGGREMVNDGLMERFDISEVYGMHNLPGLGVGEFAVRPGPFLAAADNFEIAIEGRGSHAAFPHLAIDTTLVAAHVVIALQSIISRNIDPLADAVLSVTSIHTDGNAYNIVPGRATLRGTVRTFDSGIQDLIEDRMRRTAAGTASAFGASATVTYRRNYPVVVNGTREAEFAARVAAGVAGEGRVNAEAPKSMGAEDFAFMLNARPGAFIWVGNGATAGLHHPEYDFNDEAIPAGCSYWVHLVETALPLASPAP